MTPPSSLDPSSRDMSLAVLHRLLPQVYRVSSVNDFWVESREGEEKRNRICITFIASFYGKATRVIGFFMKGSKFFPFRVDPFSEGRQKTILTVISLLKIDPFPLITILILKFDCT